MAPGTEPTTTAGPENVQEMGSVQQVAAKLAGLEVGHWSLHLVAASSFLSIQPLPVHPGQYGLQGLAKTASAVTYGDC